MFSNGCVVTLGMSQMASRELGGVGKQPLSLKQRQCHVPIPIIYYILPLKAFVRLLKLRELYTVTLILSDTVVLSHLMRT